jgi:ketosteroid isomerase-like protein
MPLKTQEVWLVAGIAYETGLYTLAVSSADGATRRISGRYVTLWKKQAAGGWKIFRDMNVSQDASPSAPS